MKTQVDWRKKVLTFSLTLPSINSRIDLHVRKDLRHQSSDHDRAIAAEKAPVLNRADWFENPAFIRMIETHNQYATEFARWRRLFAEHAAELAHLLKTFPGSENLREDDLRRIIAGSETSCDSLSQRGVFNPWTNRWSGRWSNGRLQYHIWDSTRFIDGQWIQPVSLSETGFAKACCVEEMLQNRRTDVAINVFSHENGITGWVSKRQRGRLELPHIGYLVNDTTLIWTCQIKDPENLFAPDSRWFVFLETVQNSSTPAVYKIYGQPFELTDNLLVNSNEQDKHFGTYHATNLEIQQKNRRQK
ncbi:hypothetical protein L0337_07690 [candidate division KSB1 bacterium]|nr:hypothetical protein [candidate division KSB1 bacterium]